MDFGTAALDEIEILMSAADFISSASISAAVRSALFCKTIFVVLPIAKAVSRNSTRLGCGSRFRLSAAASVVGTSMETSSRARVIDIFVTAFYHSESRFGRGRFLQTGSRHSECGSFHFVSIKHLHRYLSEFQYRFNNRKNADLFSTILRRMTNTVEMPYKQLTSEA
jgi:hypothetical protein